ncbi:hypothetical protein BLS_006963 [Venturia inaequalis]|uniref:Uncharacterized protein n=1 Tax=Venturia inaequalis TaxID=5025 RepID=A0A8H3YZW0_VENIN|nr:hypothetical protein BLS_006963 [Venturia inaequalis]KAE9975092.1 hypothetical protein EG327_008556 [Venturia inaequalis]KAE9980004.1 hypothetical protein EG328_000499 [Venturia inaequalis]RDI78158.1 hypothetical protein Vi05172_g11837 [Venturia inaequalis]
MLSSLFLSLLAFPCAVAPLKAVPEIIYQATYNGSWLENLAVTSCNKILATRLDVAELWLIDPDNKAAVVKLHSFPNANGVTGITEIRKNVFAMAVMTIDLATATVAPNSSFIWTVDISDEKDPIITLLKSISDISFANGLTTWDNNTFLISDSVQGAVYSMDSRTGAHRMVVQDATMAPAVNSAANIGINGIKRFGNYMYYTCSTKGLFARVPLMHFQGIITATGPVEILASGVFMDDFTITSDGTAFIAGNFNQDLFELPLGGQLSIFAGASTSLDVAGCTSVGLSKDRRELFVATSGASANPVNGTVIEPAKILKFILGK